MYTIIADKFAKVQIEKDILKCTFKKMIEDLISEANPVIRRSFQGIVQELFKAFFCYFGLPPP